MKKYVLFDLDGTLTDSGQGVINGVSYAMDKLGDFENDRSRLRRFVGPPLAVSFSEFLGYPPEKVELAIKYYREYYLDKGIFENSVYGGITELLDTLKEQGRTLILATSKPRPSAVTVLETFGLAKYFDFVAASELDGTRDSKDEVIAYALEQCGISDASQAVMVGDHRYDILGAKKHGLTSVACFYGYGDSADLEAAGADYKAESPGGLLAVFAGGEV